MRLLCVSLAAMLASGAAYAADLPTKKGAPAAPAAGPTASRAFTPISNSTPADCPLTYWGLTFYATVDMGVGYETHGVPFNSDYHTGVEELLQRTARALWLLTPGAQPVAGRRQGQGAAGLRLVIRRRSRHRASTPIRCSCRTGRARCPEHADAAAVPERERQLQPRRAVG